MDYKKHCRVEVGTYCEVHDKPSPTNNMVSRTHEAIALGPTGNLQGSVKFFCINTRRVLKRRNFTPIPLPDSVIAKVNAIGKKEGQGRDFRFTNRRNEPFSWTDEVPVDDDEFQGLLEPDEATFPDISAELPGVELERNQTDSPVDAVDEDPEPNFEQRAADALENADIRAGEHRNPPVAQPDNIVAAEPGEIIYEIEFDVPEDGPLVPAAGRRGADARYAANNGAYLVEDIDEEADAAEGAAPEGIEAAAIAEADPAYLPLLETACTTFYF